MLLCLSSHSVFGRRHRLRHGFRGGCVVAVWASGQMMVDEDAYAGEDACDARASLIGLM